MPNECCLACQRTSSCLGLCPHLPKPSRPPLSQGNFEVMGKKAKHVEGRSQADRIKVRQSLGKLKELTVQPSTRLRYDKARRRFLQFLADNQLAQGKGARGRPSQ